MIEKTAFEHYDPSFFPNLFYDFIKSDSTAWTVRGEADGSIDRIEMFDVMGWRSISEVTLSVRLDTPRFEAKLKKHYRAVRDQRKTDLN
ncbi:hypothetical protein ACIOZM_18965 [Pseudomonas sp. NPDC087346]|uniref:hypothetical protein n=1 Tax=Pseudomonas sp. NPDC087346 TaxID=3364438 RepID=UPI0038065761